MRCLLSVMCCVLFGVCVGVFDFFRCCLLFVEGRVLCYGCCMLFVDCCLLIGVWCLALFVVCCLALLLFVDCCAPLFMSWCPSFN